MATSENIVKELLDELSKMCELDVDTVNTLRPGLMKVIQKYMTVHSVPVSVGGGNNTKNMAKKATKKSEKTKIPHKNAYHFYVAAKMGEVKEAGVVAKERMKKIGEMWRELNENDHKPYQASAQIYNEIVDAEMKTTDWESRRGTIIEKANLSAGGTIKKNP